MLSRLAELDNKEEIKQYIQQTLSAFGGVESIHIFAPTAENPQCVVLATMVSMELASHISNSLGLRAFGHKSLIIPISHFDT